MTFTVNIQTMEFFYAKLSSLAKPAPVQCVVRDSLRHVCDHARDFDKIVSKDSPFFKEFFCVLAQGDASADTCFSLLECLIIFCREKALFLGATTLAAMEHGLLSHFENSGEWDDPALQTLMAQWYWKVLPQRHARADVSA